MTTEARQGPGLDPGSGGKKGHFQNNLQNFSMVYILDKSFINVALVQ